MCEVSIPHHGIKGGELDLSEGLAKANEVNGKFYEHAFKWKK